MNHHTSNSREKSEEKKRIPREKLEEKLVEIDQAYEIADLFKYPDTPEEVMIENCFVVVENKRQFFIGYRKNSQFMNLSNCLIRFERFMKKNYKLFLN